MHNYMMQFVTHITSCIITLAPILSGCVVCSKSIMLSQKYVILLSLTVMIHVRSERPCKYRRLVNKLFLVDCAFLSLVHIPTFSENSDVINLSNNDITCINASFPSSVTGIDLSGNKIRSLQNSPFVGLYNLKRLNLRNNYIAFNKENFYDGLFSSLGQLRELNLKGNGNGKKMDVQIDRAFVDLKDLEILDVDAQKEFYFGFHFRKLAKLKKLDLSGSTGNCDINVLREITFSNVTTIQRLDISACGIKFLYGAVFGNLTKLNYLDISRNEELGVAALSNITRDLNRTAIRVLKLDNIACGSGRSNVLRRHHFINLVNTSLVDLSVQRNKLETLDIGVLSNFPKTIRKLSLAGNRLITDNYVFEFQSMLQLQTLDLSLRLSPNRRNMGILEGLLSNCQPREDDVKFISSKNEEVKILHFKNIAKATSMILPPLPPKLQVLYLNSSRLYFRFFGNLKLKTNSLKHVYLQNNMINRWSGSISGAEKLTSLDISWNFCWRASRKILQTLKGLEILNLQHNVLGPLLKRDLRGRFFNKQMELKYLDLANNRIRHLAPLVFKNLINIEVLILANNQISEWLISVKHMKKLKRLDLSQNRLSTIAEHIRNDFNVIFSTSNVSVRIHSNRIQCTCGNLGFLRWMAANKVHFEPFNRYVCSIRSPDSFDFYEIEHSVSNLEEKCKSYTQWYVMGSIMTSLTISVICGVLIYKHRWKLRYIRFTFKKTIIRKIQKTVNSKHKEFIDYEYDAYISYTGRDRGFILHEIIPNLETKSNMKLFIRDRSFLPGESKAHQILQAIQKCKKVICVISKNYLKSDWRDYELNMARVEGIEARKSLSFVYLVLLPEVYNGEYPRKVMDLVKKKYYIEYPDDPKGYEEFWDKLNANIKERYRQ